MAERDRPAIGGADNDKISGDMDSAVAEIKAVLEGYDWSGLTTDQHTAFTSRLYSVVQQSTGPELQKNTRERETA